MEVGAWGEDVQVEGIPVRKRLAPEQLVIGAECRAESVRVPVRGLGSEVERRVDQHVQPTSKSSWPSRLLGFE